MEKMDMQAMMEVFQKLATPGPQHKILASLVGKWDTRGQCWAEPGKPMESKGTLEQKMLLDGRFLQQEFSGDTMGMPFRGVCLIGYDNHLKKYVSTWIDTMGTGILFMEGSGSADGKTINLSGRFEDPIKGPMLFRTVYRIIDQSKNTFEMYGTDKSGTEEKMMETAYTRRQ
jgi:hypothetical protein